MAFIGQSVAASVAEYVRVDFLREAGARTNTLAKAIEGRPASTVRGARSQNVGRPLPLLAH
jgi:hypothetical protein